VPSGSTLPSLLFSLAARPFSNLLDPTLPYPTLLYPTLLLPSLLYPRLGDGVNASGSDAAGSLLAALAALRLHWRRWLHAAAGRLGWGAWGGCMAGLVAVVGAGGGWRWVLAVHGCWGGRRSEVGRARVGRGGRDEGPGRRRGHSQLCARGTPEWPVCLETCENRFIVVRLHVHVKTHARRASWVR
jgi:hypothetical protein